MHSKRINFYLTTVDQMELLNDLRKRGEFLIVPWAVRDGKLRFVEASGVKDIGAEGPQVYLVRPSDVEGIRLHSLQHQTYRTVDDRRSPVVKFTTSLHRDDKLHRGRLYVTTAYYDGETLIRKEDGFVNWASALLFRPQEEN